MEKQNKRIALPEDFYYPSDDTLEKESESFEKASFANLYMQTLIPDLPLYREREGDNFIRILPPLKSPILKWWAGVYYYHYLPSGDRVVCKRSTFGKEHRCLVCEWRKSIQHINPRVAKRVYPVPRGLVWIIDAFDEESIAQGVQLLDVSYKKLILEIINACRNKRTGKLVRVEDPKNGRIISYVRTNKMVPIDGRDVSVPDYSGIKMEDESLPMDPEWVEAIRDYGPFHKLLYLPSDEIIEELILGFKDIQDNSVTEEVESKPEKEQTTVSVDENISDSLNPEEKETESETPFCFGDVSVFNPASDDCMECSYFVECAKKVKEATKITKGE